MDFGAYSSYNEDFDTGWFFGDPHTAVQSNEMKFLTDGDWTELYDLPDERNDVSDSNPEAKDELQSVYESTGIDWRSRSDRKQTEYSESQIEQLEDLGYL